MALWREGRRREPNPVEIDFWGNLQKSAKKLSPSEEIKEVENLYMNSSSYNDNQIEIKQTDIQLLRLNLIYNYWD